MCRRKRLNEIQFVRFRQFLEDKEVNVNCIDEIGFTPLIRLCQSNDSLGLYNCVDLLFQRHDTRINQTSKDGENALMEVAQLLIAKGIDIDQTNHYEPTL